MSIYRCQKMERMTIVAMAITMSDTVACTVSLSSSQLRQPVP